MVFNSRNIYLNFHLPRICSGLKQQWGLAVFESYGRFSTSQSRGFALPLLMLKAKHKSFGFKFFVIDLSQREIESESTASIATHSTALSASYH